MALSYAFDPSKGETPETIARRRQTADLIAARIFGKAPANVGEGLNAIGQALIARQMQSEATDAQKAGMASVPALFGGTGANPAAGIAASIAGQPVTPSVATPAGQTSIPGGSSEFTNTVMPLAEDASAKTGVDPRIIGAQAILETGNGKSAPGNNLFGIKSHGQPGGNVLPTTEVVNGQPVRTTDSFAAYASPQDSANGYSNFLQSNPRYKPMMAAPTLEGQAAALGQSGYATDPNYGSKVLGIAKGLPAPTGGILADNSASPLDNAQYPAGPVGAPAQAAGTPPTAPASDGEDALPANAAPAQGTLPTAQAVQAATPGAGGPFPNVSTEDLTKYAMNQFVPAANRQVIAAEITRRATAAQQANDPLRQLQIKKAQQETDSQGKFAVIGEDNMGRKQYGFVDATTGKVTPYKPETAQAPDTGLENLHGEDFFTALQQSDPAIATQVRAVVEGRAPYPTGMILKTPYGQRLAQMVTQADPSFETGNATARVKVRNEFKSGGVASPAGQISAGNTALQHAGEMSDALERMKEDGGILPSIGSAGIPFVSHIANQLHNKAVQGTPSGAALNDFMTAKNHFSEEVTKFYAGSAGSEAERARALANLDAAKSLPELRSAIKTEANLMQGKVNALQERWRNGMGPLVKDFPLISKESQDAIDRVMKRAESSNAPPQAAPAIKEGATIVNPQTGERRIMQGGKWVPVT